MKFGENQPSTSSDMNKYVLCCVGTGLAVTVTVPVFRCAYCCRCVFRCNLLLSLCVFRCDLLSGVQGADVAVRRGLSLWAVYGCSRALAAVGATSTAMGSEFIVGWAGHSGDPRGNVSLVDNIKLGLNIYRPLR